MYKVEAMAHVTKEVPTAGLSVVGAWEPPDPAYPKRIADMITEIVHIYDYERTLGKSTRRRSDKEKKDLLASSWIWYSTQSLP